MRDAAISCLNRENGFTLIELAMVLFIVSLLLGGLLVPLATQMEARQRNDATEQLERIREALIGFAIINGRLPCYTSEPDPTNALYGEEDPVCNPAGRTTDGILPWKTLGVREVDPWGIPRTGTADPWIGYWRYRVDLAFFNVFTLNTNFSAPSEQLSVVDASGNLLNSSSERPVAVIYSTGANRAVDGENITYEQTVTDNPTYQGGSVSGSFDDMTIWLTRPLLFNRMVTAGRLP